MCERIEDEPLGEPRPPIANGPTMAECWDCGKITGQKCPRCAANGAHGANCA